MITNATVKTNGFTYIVSGKVRNQEKHYMLHIGQRYRSELIELKPKQANTYKRSITDRREAAIIKQALISELIRHMSSIAS